MSLAVKKVNQYVVHDPRVTINAPRDYFIEKSGSVVSLQPQITQNYSSSSINFSVNTPNTNTIIDRHVKVQVPLEITLTGTDQGAPLYQEGQGLTALRAYPISQCTSSIALTLNNTTFSATVNDYISALALYCNWNKSTEVDMSTFPSLPDQSQNYDDLVGSSRNPLNDYSNSQFYQSGRGSYPIEVVSNTNTQAVLRTTVSEDIFLSPLLFGSNSNECGFVGVNVFNLVINLGNLSRVLSHNAVSGHTFTSVSVDIYSNPALLMGFITPQLTMPIPKEVVYGFENVVSYQTQGNAVASGNSFTLVSNNIQLNQIPSRIYVFARRQNTDLQSSTGYQYADSFARLTNLSCSFDNRVGLLSSASEEDLYRIAVKNGLSYSFPSWKQWQGSVMCINAAEDWGLSDAQAPGLYNKQINLSIQAQFKNINANTVNFTMFIVVVSDGVLTIDTSGTAVQQLGVLTEMDILDAPNLPVAPKRMVQNIYGGSFWKDLQQFGSQALGSLKKSKALSKTLAGISHPAAQIGSQIADALGYGSGIVGGAKMSKKKLMRRLR